eukprot:gene1475-1926_t
METYGNPNEGLWNDFAPPNLYELAKAVCWLVTKTKPTQHDWNNKWQSIGKGLLTQMPIKYSKALAWCHHSRRRQLPGFLVYYKKQIGLPYDRFQNGRLHFLMRTSSGNNSLGFLIGMNPLLPKADEPFDPLLQDGDKVSIKKKQVKKPKQSPTPASPPEINAGQIKNHKEKLGRFNNFVKKLKSWIPAEIRKSQGQVVHNTCQKCYSTYANKVEEILEADAPPVWLTTAEPIFFPQPKLATDPEPEPEVEPAPHSLHDWLEYVPEDRTKVRCKTCFKHRAHATVGARGNIGLAYGLMKETVNSLTLRRHASSSQGHQVAMMMEGVEHFKESDTLIEVFKAVLICIQRSMPLVHVNVLLRYKLGNEAQLVTQYAIRNIVNCLAEYEFCLIQRQTAGRPIHHTIDGISTSHTSHTKGDIFSPLIILSNACIPTLAGASKAVMGQYVSVVTFVDDDMKIIRRVIGALKAPPTAKDDKKDKRHGAKNIQRVATKILARVTQPGEEWDGVVANSSDCESTMLAWGRLAEMDTKQHALHQLDQAHSVSTRVTHTRD